MEFWQVSPAFHSIFRHEKKVLALVLAFACAFTMFAGAAFTDQADINADNVEAVDLLTTLGIIKGYEDGSFDPEGTVDRAEMAKMIYTIRNGGNDDASAYESVTTSFTDISGHWAEGYVKYLQNTGIVAGKSATQFDPDSQVTTGEAMKMALVLAGYRADKAELTGTNWLNNTVSRATTVGMTKDVHSAIAGGCTRQDAAQILSNTLTEVWAVQWSEVTNSFLNDSKQGLAWGGAPITVGNKWMDLTVYVGQMMSSGQMSIRGNAAGKDRFIVDVDTVDNYDYNPNGGNTNVSFKDGKDHTDLVGQEVKVLTGDKIDEVFGVYATDTSKVVETTMDKVEWDNGDFKIDGTTYDMNGARVYTDNGAGAALAATFTANNQKASDIVKLIDWDDNGDYETVITKTVAVGEVTYVGSTGITISTVGSRDAGFLNGNSYTFDDDTIYEGVAKEDYAVVTLNQYTGDYVVEKAETVVGTVNGLVQNERKVRVDGTWYTLANDGSGAQVGDVDLYTIDGSRTTFTNGDKITLIVVGDIAYYAKATSGNDANRSVLMVYGKMENAGLWRDTDQAKVILANGDKKTVDIDTDNGTQVGALRIGQMYYYEVNNDKEYAFYEINANVEKTLAGYDTVVNSFGITSNKVATAAGAGNTGNAIADDAVIFALVGGDDAKVYTGKQVKDAATGNNYGDARADGSIEVTNGALQALSSTEAGFTYARMMNIELGAELNNTVNYGYLLEDAVKSKTESNIMEYRFWNGTEIVEATESTDTNKEQTMLSGSLITYDLDGEGKIKNVRLVNATDDGLVEAAITAADGDKIAISYMEGNNPANTVIEADSDTTVIYVDSKQNNADDRGVSNASGYKYTANYDAANNRYINALYFMNDAGDKVEFILIDVDGELKNAGTIANVAGLTAGAVTGNDPAYGEQVNTLTIPVTIANVDTSVAANQNLTVAITDATGANKDASFTVTGAANNAFAATKTVNVTIKNANTTVAADVYTATFTNTAAGSISVNFTVDKAGIADDTNFTLNEAEITNNARVSTGFSAAPTLTNATLTSTSYKIGTVAVNEFTTAVTGETVTATLEFTANTNYKFSGEDSDYENKAGTYWDSVDATVSSDGSTLTLVLTQTV